MEVSSENNGESLFKPEEFKDFLNATRAEGRPWNRWAGPTIMQSLQSGAETAVEEPKTDHRIFGIPRLDFLFDSANEENVLLAQNYVYELGLIRYSDRVVEQWGSSSGKVRQRVLSMMTELDLKGLGNILAEALEDPNPEIVSFALAYLEHRSYPETTHALTRIVEAGPPNYFYSALKAIESSPSEQACELVMKFATKRLGNSPFKQFRELERLKSIYPLAEIIIDLRVASAFLMP